MHQIRPPREAAWLPALVCLALSATFARAGFFPFSEWSTAPDVYYKADAAGDQSGGAFHDITALYYRHVGSEHFFRMDLSAKPAASDFEYVDYMVNIDHVSGGVTSSVYLASGMGSRGIDAVVDAHYRWVTDNYTNHWHPDNHGANPPINFSILGLLARGGAFRNSNNAGKSLELMVPDSVLPSRAMKLYGAAHLIYGSTYDVTDALPVTPPCAPTSASSVLDTAGGWGTNGCLRNISAVGQTSVKVTITNGLVHFPGFLNTFIFQPKRDTDGDGLPDELDPDNDNDGLLDVTELTGTAFAPATATDLNRPDTDGDGVSDWRESVAGTDPLDNAAYLRITAVFASSTGTEATVSWLARSNHLYTVRADYWSTNAFAFTNVVETHVRADGSASPPWYATTNSYTDVNAASTNHKFYVIQAEP